ncbi:PP2C family protein-serine/threonine phosphatase [Streptomyces sp. NPDC014894]|uniref:PP2C family protein-serine/threonine phosphatase n=1 Tax=Streptomyces sp. NPDC014894 TaxID=3364931 RepID=UPI0036F90999
MDSYGTAQLPGDRANQCDATAVWTAPGGTRAYVLLDGVGDTPTVRAWTRTAARRLARTAALHADAETALRAERDRYAAEPGRHPDDGSRLPCAAAVVVVHTPHTPGTPGMGGVLSFAWSGDARAYLLLDGHLRLITEDHNERRAYEGHGDRNVLTACLGAGRDDKETEERYGHPAVETVRGPARPGRLLLTSDGAYEPHEDGDHDLAGYLTGAPRTSARRLVDDAVRRARTLPDPYADNATALIAHLT